MLVYGRNVARDLLKKEKKIEKIFLQDGFDDNEIISLIENNKIKVEFRTKKEIDNLANGLHQGIILSVSDYQYKELDLVFKNNDDLKQQVLSQLLFLKIDKCKLMLLL